MAVSYYWLFVMGLNARCFGMLYSDSEKWGVVGESRGELYEASVKNFSH